MKFKLLCLILALVMVLPIILTGCTGGETVDEDAKDDAVDIASETTVSLRMFMITEDHVPTQEEVDAVKAEKGDTSKEYIEIKAKMDAYANVAAELDKITKAKFRTHLDVVYYTIDEYRAVEEIMEFQAKAGEMRDAAKTALKKFRQEQIAFGNSDEVAIKKAFYEKYPEYAAYTEAETLAETVVTEAETVTNKYGISELKYPDIDDKQVDIVCVVGYDNYLRYIKNGWLHEEIDSDLDSSSKAISTYVNEKFLSIAAINDDNKVYGIPNNKPIGEYTYLLLHKDLYAEFQYDYESVTSLGNITEFLKDIKNSDRYKNEYVPLTGELELTNTFFWSLDYTYSMYNPTGVESDTVKIATKEELDPTRLYYTKYSYTEKDESGNDVTKEAYRLITLDPVLGQTYYTAKGNAFNGTSFDAGKIYYTDDGEGGFVQATEYVEGEKYYTVTFTDAKLAKDDDPGEFKSGTIYYIKGTDGVYTRLHNFKANETYYVVESAAFNRDVFSILGNTMISTATQGTFVSTALISSQTYKNQMLVMKEIEENGYYDPDAINDKTKKYAAAVVKGGADLAAEYVNGVDGATFGEQYHLIVLEYPRAKAEELCQNLISVSSATKNLKRAMQVITYINTNADFRNLLQYGIEGVNYNLESTTINGKTYNRVHRLNQYYMMDIYKTGNTFIAYPEEYMDYQAWDYGKLQNADAKFDPMLGFEVTEYVDKIDFSTVDRVKELSADIEARIKACATEDELSVLFTELQDELNKNTLYKREIVHGVAQSEGSASPTELKDNNYNPYGVYHNYTMWWTPLYYVEED